MRVNRRILLSTPHMSGREAQYVAQAFESNWLSTVGPNLVALEEAFQELAGLPSLGVSSGTAGIHLALRLVGIRQSDEVVTQSLTFVASANPILYERARPILMDSERSTWNLDPNLLEEFLSKRARDNRLPKAVIVVHLFGQPATINEIVDICRKYDVFLIEDAAESLGSRFRGKHPGTFGDVGIFSFNGNKIITGTTGGLVISQRSDWIEKARYFSTQARDPDPEKTNNYVHTEVGFNYRMSNVVAGIVRGQLEILPQRVNQRRAVFNRYCKALADIPGFEPQPDPPGSIAGPEMETISTNATFHSRWLSCFLVDREKFGMSAGDLIRWLDAANVESRPVWRPMHVQPLFSSFERVGGSVAEDLNRRGICLPSSSSLTEEDQQFVIDTVRSAHFQSFGCKIQ